VAPRAHRATSRDTGHGRTETRTLKTANVADLGLPHAHQAVKDHPDGGETSGPRMSGETVYAVTNPNTTQVSPDDLARLVREHWTIALAISLRG
jgi:hypothetical protein